MGNSSESTLPRPGSLADPGASTLPPGKQHGPPMADVQCPACKARFSLAVGRSLRIWQNAQGQLLQVELCCPTCGRLEQLPIQTRLIFGSVPRHLRELSLPTDLQGKDDGHRPSEKCSKAAGWEFCECGDDQCPGRQG